MHRRAGRHPRHSSGWIAILLLLVTWPSLASAATYYVSPGGNDGADGSEVTPWATFAHAMTVLQPADTLTIGDGVYTEPLNVTVSGTAGAPVTIRAASDGGAIIDGQDVIVPCTITGSFPTVREFVVLEGLRCVNGSPYAVRIREASNVTVRRVSAYQAGASPGSSLFGLQEVTDSVLEDVAASGRAQEVIGLLYSARVTLRRCWVQLSEAASGTYVWGVSVTSSNDVLVENCVVKLDPLYDHTGHIATAFLVVSAYGAPAQGNRLWGNVVYGGWEIGYLTTHQDTGPELLSTRFQHDVTIDSVTGLFVRADSDLLFEHLTSIQAGTHVTASVDSSITDPTFEIDATGRSSALVGGGTGYAIDGDFRVSVQHDHDVLSGLVTPYSGTSPGPSDPAIVPSYDVATYGKGAYLFVAEGAPQQSVGLNGEDAGAQVLYRLQNGAVTATPLWPWPLENRILAERGVSPTYESAGGLWKSLAGVYGSGASPPPVGPTPAPPGAGLPLDLGVGCACSASPGNAAGVAALWILWLAFARRRSLR